MPQKFKALTIVAFCVFPLALGAALLLLWRIDPSTQVKYERITQDMHIEGVKELLKSSGSGTHPGDTAGKYRFDTKKQFHHVENPKADEKWWYWRFDDGLIIAAFDKNGVILWKQFFRRT